ncbi:MAG TPA: NlpC/P60 family protein [Terriglobales bacterium]|nr:NlpC/P60 family protein [Terriglobales bacterium]
MRPQLLLFLVFALACARAQEGTRSTADLTPGTESDLRPLTWSEGVEIIRITWQNLSKFDSPIDCSHLVNDVYELAGLHYPYATSNQIYEGIDGFERVLTPQPADLIVWPGHVGIVVNPQEHSFYSSLNSGLKIDSYDGSAWRARGPARFFRFLIHDTERVRSLSAQRASNSRDSESTLVDGPKAIPSLSATPASARQAKRVQEQSSDDVFLNWERPSKVRAQDSLLRAWSNASDDRQDRWEHAREVVIVDSLKVQRVHVRGGVGFLEARIRTAARLTADGMETRPSGEAVKFRLIRSSNGWRVADPGLRMYLSGDAAVVAISERLAGMARENASRTEQAQAAALLHSMLR